MVQATQRRATPLGYRGDRSSGFSFEAYCSEPGPAAQLCGGTVFKRKTVGGPQIGSGAGRQRKRAVFRTLCSFEKECGSRSNSCEPGPGSTAQRGPEEIANYFGRLVAAHCRAYAQACGAGDYYGETRAILRSLSRVCFWSSPIFGSLTTYLHAGAEFEKQEQHSRTPYAIWLIRLAGIYIQFQQRL